MKPKKKIKSRRKFSRDEFFAKKDRVKSFILDQLISDKIPDPEEKQKYIESLLHGLETEPILEITDEQSGITTRDY